MSQAKYYSPTIRRDLVPKLYWKAQSLDLPMTQLVDRIVAERAWPVSNGTPEQEQSQR